MKRWREVAIEVMDMLKSLSYMMLAFAIVRLLSPLFNHKDSIEVITFFFSIFAIFDIISTLKRYSDKKAKERLGDGKKVRRTRRVG